MKNVLVLASTFPRWKDDSTPSFVFDLCRELSKKYRIHVLVPHAKGALKHEKMSNVEVSRYQYFSKSSQKVAYGAGIIPNIKSSFLAKIQVPSFLASQYASASSLIKKEKPQLIHAHWIIPQGVIGALLKKKYRIPLITTIHGSDLFPIKNKALVKLQKYAVEKSDRITVPTRAAFDELTSRFPDAKDKTTILSMGVDTSLFKPQSKPAKTSQTPKKRKTILFVGRLNEQKGVEYLIKSLQKVMAKIQDVNLAIVGEGEYKIKLQQAAKDNGVSDMVEFMGAAKKSDLPSIYNSSGVLVLPSVTTSIGTEGMGLVLIEAMACGTPVIGSSSGGIKNVIKDRKNGLIFKERNHEELAAKIISVLSDKKLSEKLSRNGIIASKEFSWSSIGKKFSSLYEEALK
jgi:glycosyltransferase involved in cell wall biosynthesis